MRHNFIALYWGGEGPLWKIYWLYGVIGSLFLFGSYLYGRETVIASGPLRAAAVAAFATYTVWIVVSVWRCARNSRSEVWRDVARALTITWAINVTLIIIFVELDFPLPARN